METYTVKDVAKMLNTTEETVRRWIRSGKLKAHMDSRKTGQVITETMLNEFARSRPKYSAALGLAGAATEATATLIGSVILGAIEASKEKKNAKFGPSEIENLLCQEIKESKERIKRKKASFFQLQTELNEEELKLKNLELLLKDFKQENTEEGGNEHE